MQNNTLNKTITKKDTRNTTTRKNDSTYSHSHSHSHSQFLKEMFEKYKDNPDFVEDINVVGKVNNLYHPHSFIKIPLTPYDNRTDNHFKLLRKIAQQLQDKKYSENIEYLQFLKDLLFQILEENAISQIYKDNEDRNKKGVEYKDFGPGLMNWLSKDKIFIHNGSLSISNSQLREYIDNLLSQQNKNGGRKSRRVRKRNKKTKKLKRRKR